VFYQWHPQIPRRGIYHAFRSIETARRYLRRSADNVTFFDLGTEVGRRAIFGVKSFDAEAAADELAKVIEERDAGGDCGAAWFNLMVHDRAAAHVVLHRPTSLNLPDSIHRCSHKA
jgi:hypothetical protein